MRTWLLAVAALTLVALTGPLTAERRSSALAVRVSVVRSCSVNTDSALQSGGTVTCGSRYGPPVMSTSSTITVPVSVPPGALVETSAAERDRLREQGDAQPTRQAEPGLEWIGETSTLQSPGTAAGPQGETMALRVVTVNF